jgi:microcystin-dependent protein
MTPAECANLFQEVMDTMTNYPIGSIHATVGQLPDGCLWCDGTAYLAAAYPLLAAEIDSQFVSGGMITIPDLTGVFLRGGGVVGEYGGEAEHTLTVDEMPAHDHGGHLHLTGQFTGEIPTPVPDVPLPDLFGSRGGGQPHNNLPPFFTVKYFIVAK